MDTWNLTPFYPGFDSPEFLADLSAYESLISDFEGWQPVVSDPSGTLESYLRQQGALHLLQDRLMHYCELCYTGDTAHPDAQKYLQRLEELGARTTAAETALISFLGQLEHLETVINGSAALEAHRFILMELQHHARYLLSSAEEVLIAKLKTSGSSAWELLHSQITAELMIPFEREGETKMVTLSEIRGLASHADKALRKAAYEAELSAYPAIASSAAQALNAIKGEVLTLSARRGYPSPLHEALISSRMQPKTLEAMIKAIEARLPQLRRYLLKKADMMGYSQGLPFYELFAPMGDAGLRYDIPQAKALIIEVFNDFSPDLGAFAQNAFDAGWVDWLPRKGKVGGAFCSYSHALKESRILMNFTGSLDDITTLAHELGHGYHDAQLADETIHNIHYPMPLAETASIFCETLMAHALIRKLPKEAQLGIRELRLQMVSQVLIDIYSRFLFEQALFDKRQTFTLPPEELNQLMLECQQLAYGEGLDPQWRHPAMWICKPHYYSGGLSYYNFPYAFGLLFGTGLYSRYRQEGESFVAAYRSLLRDTGKQTVEAVAAAAGLDLTTPAFWEDALAILIEEIDAFAAL